MKRITVELSTQSIKKAIKELERQKKRIQSMQADVLQWTCEWVRDRANFYVELSDVGTNVKQGIINGWEIKAISPSQYILENTYEKAVYVEFGIGIVGEQNPHENANSAGYEYNVPSLAKDENEQWVFYSNTADLDIPQSSMELGSKKFKNDKSGRMRVVTAGTKGAMYAYNAVVDFNVSGLKDIADKVNTKYWS